MIIKIDSDPTGNYVTHQVPRRLFMDVKHMFHGYVFTRVTKEGAYLIMTHAGQRKSISKYFKIDLP